MVVVIKSAAASLPFQRHIHGRRIGEIDIQPAVAIVVNQEFATAHRFQDVFLLRIGRMFKADAGALCNVFELRKWAVFANHLFNALRRGRRR